MVAKGERSSRAWAGRFVKPTAEVVEAYVSSVTYDRRLATHDIAGSRAHVAMLARQGIVTDGEASQIAAGLDAIETELATGDFDWRDSDEDVHMSVERRLIELVGAVGGKLHTARSRNDQVALDLRLYCRETAKSLSGSTAELAGALLGQARANPEVVMPGYTHLQRAQPVLLAHHLAAHGFALMRDVGRFEAAYESADAMPLGAAALAGTTFDIDPASVAKELGFSRLVEDSMDAVADRDFALDLAFACTVTMLHVSRLAEEIVLWTTGEFGFATPDDAYATGSSIMPQKRNPDVAELARGKAGRVIGELTGLATILKGLPLAYNTDLQEAKEVLFDLVDLTAESIPVMAGMVATLVWHPDRMLAAAEGGFSTATELADHLAAQGLPFREAHEIAGRAVRMCEEQGKGLADLTPEELTALSPLLSPDVLTLLSATAAAARRTSPGGTAPVRVSQELDVLADRIAAALTWAKS